MKTTMIVLTADTPEEFVLEQIQQRYNYTEEQAKDAVEKIKAI